MNILLKPHTFTTYLICIYIWHHVSMHLSIIYLYKKKNSYKILKMPFSLNIFPLFGWQKISPGLRLSVSLVTKKHQNIKEIWKVDISDDQLFLIWQVKGWQVWRYLWSARQSLWHLTPTGDTYYDIVCEPRTSHLEDEDENIALLF